MHAGSSDPKACCFNSGIQSGCPFCFPGDIYAHGTVSIFGGVLCGRFQYRRCDHAGIRGSRSAPRGGRSAPCERGTHPACRPPDTDTDRGIPVCTRSRHRGGLCKSGRTNNGCACARAPERVKFQRGQSSTRTTHGTLPSRYEEHGQVLKLRNQTACRVAANPWASIP